MIKLLQGDCLELMKDIPDKSIDLILTDPPYLISKKSGFNSGGAWNNAKTAEEHDRVKHSTSEMETL